ncbi:DEAD/DEAH box helicase [Thioalkalivibrio sp. ALE16]|uniref:DEAD/DEAH box helicase n=1 Tax=Thioalkalivibrio sp. ALE16 TaxID=1158172 RepID=UPI00036F9226|nr:DEAD/DEAH box helicase [Thioalkalivibrio sp. ALE16]
MDNPKGQDAAPSSQLSQAVKEVLDGQFNGLRNYQREASECFAYWVRKTLSPLLLVLPTGAGKSHLIAAMAAILQAMALRQSGRRKKILCIAPSGELVQQNHSKMAKAGYPASLFSAAAGDKDHTGEFIFANPETLRINIDKLIGYEFAGIFVDEAHRISPQIKEVIETVRGSNPNVRVIGLTATPYRLGWGYIFQRNVHLDTPPLTEEYARDPYFGEMIYEVSPHYLIEEGYILPPVFGTVRDHYDTTGLKRSVNMTWTPESEEAVFQSVSATERTQRILEQVTEKMVRRNACMIFAQNVKHAELVLKLLPVHHTQKALITAATPKKKRRRILDRFLRTRGIKYIVNVGTLTTGFDAPHVDLIAVLRATHSAALFQQIIGRGLRLSPETGKRDCLVLDYAQNLARFCPDGDPFSPQIQAAIPQDGADQPLVEVACPTCAAVNEFRSVKLPAGARMDDHGYLVAIESGEYITNAAGQKLAGHMGRQCLYRHAHADGTTERCKQTWACRECPACGTLNSAYDPFCTRCTTILSKGMEAIQERALTSSEAAYNERRGKVIELHATPTKTYKGDSTLKVAMKVKELPYLVENEEGEPELVEPDVSTVDLWLSPHWRHPAAKDAWARFKENCLSGDPIMSPEELKPNDERIKRPLEISYRPQRPRQGEERSRFFEVVEYRVESEVNRTGRPDRKAACAAP